MKIAIIGAGPAGLTTAYQLSKEKGIELDVYEAGNGVGGLSKTLNLWGYRVDLGPHRFFSNDSRVNRLWLELAGGDYQMVDRMTRIYYNGRFFNYPLRPANALRNLGMVQAAHCVWSFAKEKLHPTPQRGDFETWVSRRFGKRLYEIFFKTYSEKLWGIPCHQLDADFAAQRIKKLSLSEAIKNAFQRNGDNPHQTLVDQFAYPHQGTGIIYERMKTRIEASGGRIFLHSPVKRVLTVKKSVYGLQLEDGSEHHYDYVVSSMPLSLLVSRMSEIPPSVRALANQLKFRNTLLVYLHVESNKLFPDNWLYIHSNDLQMGRITNFRNWVPQLYDNQQGTVLAIEYWCSFEDELWQTDHHTLIAMAGKELRQSGLLKGQRILDGKVIPIPRCYPVYTKNYKAILSPIEIQLRQIENLAVIGRYGAFKYNNQDHSMLMGIMAAENIVNGRQHNLWEINTDYESYQERSAITETGLVVSNA